MIQVISVPHTGSHFVVETIGYELRNLDMGGKVQNLVHCYPGESVERAKEAKRKGATIVCPLRHPMAVAQSWANRGKPIAKHRVHHTMCDLFKILINEIDPLGPFYVPVDVPDREKWLSRLGDEIGENLQTEWKPVSHHDIKPAPIPESDRIAVEELLTHPFFARFSYDGSSNDQENDQETARATA